MYTWDIVPVLALETMAVPMYHILGWCSPNRGCVEACSHFQGRVPHQSRVVHSAHSCYQRTYPSKTQTYTYHVTSHTGYHTTDDTTYHNTLCTICFRLANQSLDMNHTGMQTSYHESCNHEIPGRGRRAVCVCVCVCVCVYVFSFV